MRNTRRRNDQSRHRAGIPFVSARTFRVCSGNNSTMFRTQHNITRSYRFILLTRSIHSEKRQQTNNRSIAARRSINPGINYIRISDTKNHRLARDCAHLCDGGPKRPHQTKDEGTTTTAATAAAADDDDNVRRACGAVAVRWSAFCAFALVPTGLTVAVTWPSSSTCTYMHA